MLPCEHTCFLEHASLTQVKVPLATERIERKIPQLLWTPVIFAISLSFHKELDQTCKNLVMYKICDKLLHPGKLRGFWVFCSYRNLTYKSKCPVTADAIALVLRSVLSHTCICSRQSTPLNSPISSFHTCTIQFRRGRWFHLNYLL